MQHLSASGNAFELGKSLGEGARDVFARIIEPSDDFQRLYRRLPAGWLTRVATAVRDRFPTVWQELEGMAEGLVRPVEQVLLWNCRGDINPTGPEGCSSVAVDGGGERWLAHNEDGDPALRDACFLLQATPEDGPAFLTFCYPGSLPGHTFALNAAGFAFTVNNLRLTEHPAGIPRMVTARALVACDDSNEALALLRDTPRTGGYHFMMADRRERAPLSVEAPFHRVTTREAAPVAVHTNHLVQSGCTDLPQRVTASSAARQARLESWRDALTGIPSADELLAILGDRSDPNLPLYRTAADDPDGENTLATALLRLDPAGATAIVRTAPDGPIVAERRFDLASPKPEHRVS